jgi:4-hydroxybenzoate polyprenyltransferase
MSTQSRAFSRIHRYIMASYLFVRWDVTNMMTIVCFLLETSLNHLQCRPQMTFSVISSSANGLPSALHFGLCAAWIYLHGLFLCIANQCSSAEEDVINKPFRPLPSGLISRQEAIGFLLGLIPVCIGASLSLGASGASAALMAASVSYCFLKLDYHWLTKNASNVAIWFPSYLGAWIVLSMYLSLAKLLLCLIILNQIISQRIGHRL